LKSPIHKDIIISGRVQGVGFRFSARNMARIYGIKGYVKNLPNGDVYIEAEGEEPEMQHFLIWCNKGPDHAYIDSLHISDADVKGYSSFEVRF
jgi:acylphosphatase